MQMSKACCDRCPPENTLKSAVDVTDVSANDFRLLPNNEPPSSDSGILFPNEFNYFGTENLIHLIFFLFNLKKIIETTTVH